MKKAVLKDFTKFHKTELVIKFEIAYQFQTLFLNYLLDVPGI